MQGFVERKHPAQAAAAPPKSAPGKAQHAQSLKLPIKSAGRFGVGRAKPEEGNVAIDGNDQLDIPNYTNDVNMGKARSQRDRFGSELGDSVTTQSDISLPANARGIRSDVAHKIEMASSKPGDDTAKMHARGGQFGSLNSYQAAKQAAKSMGFSLRKSGALSNADDFSESEEEENSEDDEEGESDDTGFDGEDGGREIDMNGAQDLDVKGDSYPATTSGHYTEDEQEQHEQDRAPVLHETPQGNRVSHHRAHTQASYPEHEVQGQRVELDFAQSHQQELYKESIQRSQHLKATEQMQVKKRKAPQPANDPDVFAHPAHFQHVPAATHCLDPEQTPVSPPYTAPKQPLNIQFQPQETPTRKGATRQLLSNGMNHVDLAARPPAGTRLGHQVDRDMLDYGLTTLYEKNYASLGSEPFDKDAHDEDLEHLDEKFVEFAQRTPAEQQQFFATLTIDEWEIGGLWFNDQFADLTQQLQKSRQARRTLARGFENITHARHKAVTKEQESLEEALKDMRKSGGRVLDKSTATRTLR